MLLTAHSTAMPIRIPSTIRPPPVDCSDPCFPPHSPRAKRHQSFSAGYHTLPRLLPDPPRAAAGDAERLFSVYPPDTLRCEASRPAGELLVNVWDWDPQWRVEYSEDGGRTFRPMERCLYDDQRALDPAVCARFGTAGNPRIPARPWIKAVVTDHLFRCTPGSERVVIRVVSRFGETRTQEVAL